MADRLDVRIAAPEEPGVLAAAYAGAVWRLERAPCRDAALDLAREAVVAHLGPAPRSAQFRLGAAFFESYSAARSQLLAHPDNLRRAARIALGLGLPAEGTRIDRLRLRAVPSGGHRDPAAAAAYRVHRDTWYANPAAQVNLWMALDEVTEDEAFDFYPAHWDRAIANDSAGFDLEAWHRAGGWQAGHAHKHFPSARTPPVGPAVRLACAAGHGLLFSATHLHGTHAHDSGRTRFSLELRLVHEPDVPALSARRQLDDRSRGSTLAEMARVCDVLR